MSHSRIPRISAEEAATFIYDGDNVGFSGFTPAGTPKAIPLAIAQRAEQEHEAGRPFRIGVLTGASTGPSLDGALARANAISFRTPYQSDPELRKRINAGHTRFFDIHLSMVCQMVRHGSLGKINAAIIEAADVNDDGEIVLTSAVGAAATYARVADKVIIELNRFHPPALRGMHDIYEPADPPFRREIPIYKVRDRIGSPVLKVDPIKIFGVVETDLPDEGGGFAPSNAVCEHIGANVAEFLAAELRTGRMPRGFLPIQSGVGNIANSVLAALGRHHEIPPFEMYTEVLQDSVISLMREDRVTFASASSLTLGPQTLQSVYADLEWFKSRIVLRPEEITNSPELVRRLGLISMNTALEVDIFGNVNSTHVMGKEMMNGIGGSGDFTRNAFLSIFSCPSTVKGGKISTIVPLVSHTDHSEHSVQVVATEWGVADLRGKSPNERARAIVDHCAHPDFRRELHGYFQYIKDGHTPQTLGAAFALHERFLKEGDMRGINWSEVFGN